MKLVKLSKLPIGKEGIIRNILYKKNVSKRLQELGFIKGNKVKMLMISPKEKTFIMKVLWNYSFP